jgi:anthranilate phosphoribosyltransferase
MILTQDELPTTDMAKTPSLRILNQKDFENTIKEIMKSKAPITMIEAILFYCESKKIEVETAASLITPRMKSEIEAEAIGARMLLNRPARLPIE